ncbi:MAG: hypothetical protein MJ138_04270 [Kiritimatiellae bacterium]|nr:hypothetical protein [Kiritimatiellia bacterium]
MGKNSGLLGSVLEYREPVERPSVRWGRWAAAGLLTVIAVFFVLRQVAKKRAEIRVAQPVAATAADVVSAGVTNAPARRLAEKPSSTVAPAPAKASAVSAKTPPPPSPAALRAKRWLDESSNRSRDERVLLERLYQAELSGNMRIAIDSIEQLLRRPTMSDVGDALARRLGALNVDFVLSGQPTLWTAEIDLRQNDTPFLVARRHRTTVEAVRRLNNLRETHAFPAAMKKVRVLNFPNASLVVHKRTRVADLTLNGKFFKRYYVSVSADVAAANYPITAKASEGPQSRFKALGIRMSPDDESELRMFLAPGAQLTVSDL